MRATQKEDHMTHDLEIRCNELENELSATVIAAEQTRKLLLARNEHLQDLLIKQQAEFRELQQAKSEVEATAQSLMEKAADRESWTGLQQRIVQRLRAFYADATQSEVRGLWNNLAEPDPACAELGTYAAHLGTFSNDLLNALLTSSGRLPPVLGQKRLNRAVTALGQSGLFDAAWYQERYPDVAAAAISPEEHYLRHGAREGRFTSALHEAATTGTLLAPRHKPRSTVAEVLASTEVISHGELTLGAREDALRLASQSGAKVSVIMPTYNREGSIVPAIRSALNQSFPASEIIVADDQSTDGTLGLLRDIFRPEIDANQLIILECDKGGVCKMRNAALAAATGDVIAFLDSDNIWHQDHLAWAVAALHASGAQSVYTGANIHHLGEDWSRIDCTPFDRRQLLAQNFIDLNSFLHRHALFQKHGNFDTNLTRLVDWDYIIRLTKDSEPVRVPVATVEYFLDKSSLGNISFQESLQENALKIQLKHRSEMRAFGILNANAERKLDDLAAQNLATPVRAATQAVKPAQVQAATAVPAKRATPVQGQMPYFGGLGLFVVLPAGITVPANLPTGLVLPRFISILAPNNWTEQTASGDLVETNGPLPDGCYWYPDLHQAMPTDHQLATMVAATALTSIDMAIASYALDTDGMVAVECLRNQMVLRAPLIEGFVQGRLANIPFTGKILRIPDSRQSKARSHPISRLLGVEVALHKDAQHFAIGCEAVPASLRSENLALPQIPKSLGKQRILVLAQKLAVGGVERNTIEVARQLAADHECIYLTLEKIYPEQGSLGYQATEVCANTIDLAEIGHHGIYQKLLERLHGVYRPDVLWVCNGSMWFSANSEFIRRLFHDCGIVDQEVYDQNAGWINHYNKPGIQSFDRFIAINRKIHDRFTQHFKMDPDKIDLIYSAINAGRFRNARLAGHDINEMRAEFGLPLGKKLFVFMGRLVEQKRPLDFLKIAQLCQDKPDQHFVLVGNGVLAPALEAFLEENRPTNVTWIKNVADTTRFWPAVDCYLVTSEYEGLPIALLEAISLGVPVVATDVGDIDYVLQKYQAGRVVSEIGNPELFAQTLQDFAPELAAVQKSLKTKGEEIIDFFSAETISRQFAESFMKARRTDKG